MHSSESEGDEGSIESGDLGFMRYEEDVCPEGCDKGLYDLTFTLRGQRKEIDVLKKELDVNLKKIKVATALYETNHEELEILQREKQQRLNEVKCLVLLKLDKIHSFREDSDRLEDMSKTLVFSRETLKKLYARVGELDKETQEQMEIHMKNRKHLHRLKLDCQYMVERIRLLKEDINECMFRKFNGRIDLDELEEAILRRLVAEMRSSLKTIKEYYEKVIQEMKVQCQCPLSLENFRTLQRSPH
ncbi:hypothetical protein C0J52_03892 [Blattella germanica]|nr:hypothetical protein C0J52_03892 [Blattella germanica]